MDNKHGVVAPDAQSDYHGHPNYGKVLITLLVLFGSSLIVGYLFSPVLAVVIIFATAVWKTALVMKNFMHLKFEPLFIWIAIAVVMFALFILFWGIYPDITAVTLDVVPK